MRLANKALCWRGELLNTGPHATHPVRVLSASDARITARRTAHSRNEASTATASSKAVCPALEAEDDSAVRLDKSSLTAVPTPWRSWACLRRRPRGHVRELSGRCRLANRLLRAASRAALGEHRIPRVRCSRGDRILGGPHSISTSTQPAWLERRSELILSPLENPKARRIPSCVRRQVCSSSKLVAKTSTSDFGLEAALRRPELSGSM